MIGLAKLKVLNFNPIDLNSMIIQILVEFVFYEFTNRQMKINFRTNVFIHSNLDAKVMNEIRVWSS